MRQKTENENSINEPYKLPEGWKWARLGELFSFQQGIAMSPSRRQGISPHPFLRTLNVLWGKIDLSNLDKMDFTNNEVSKLSLKPEDLLICEGGEVGRTAVWNGEIDICLHQNHVHRLRKLSNEVIPEFYMYWMRTAFQIFKFYIGQASETTIPNLSIGRLKSFLVPLPPLEVQRRIASKIQEIMQEVERAQTACEKQLEAVKLLPSAYLREVFESEEAKKWERKRLGEVCMYDSGVWGDEPDESSQCHFVLRSNNIKDGNMVFDELAIRKVDPKYLSTKVLKEGDILITTSSGSKDLLGKSAIFVPPDDKIYLFSNFTMRLRAISEIVYYSYLYFYLQSPATKNILTLIQDTTTGLRNLNRKQFLNQLVSLPPLETQRRIAADLKEKMAYVEKLRTAIEKQLEAINALPQVILRKAFRGEL